MHQVARLVEADQVAYPAQRGDVGDAVVIAHQPGPFVQARFQHTEQAARLVDVAPERSLVLVLAPGELVEETHLDRKSTRLNSSHVEISYAVFCLKKKKKK